MRVGNEHERRLNVLPSEVGRLLDTLGSPHRSPVGRIALGHRCDSTNRWLLGVSVVMARGDPLSLRSLRARTPSGV